MTILQKRLSSPFGGEKPGSVAPKSLHVANFSRYRKRADLAHTSQAERDGESQARTTAHEGAKQLLTDARPLGASRPAQSQGAPTTPFGRVPPGIIQISRRGIHAA